MPSKKKARSQARKAKKEEARQQAAISSDIRGDSAAPGGSSCNHIKFPEDRTLADFKEARDLFIDFDTKHEAHIAKIYAACDIGGEVGTQMKNDAIDHGQNFACDILQKFHLLDEANKDVLRQLLISKGINWILDAQEKGIDFMRYASHTTKSMRTLMIFLQPLFYLIDWIDQAYRDDFTSLSSQINHILASPREFVKFFHEEVLVAA
jgi:hypothetical protein